MKPIVVGVLGLLVGAAGLAAVQGLFSDDTASTPVRSAARPSPELSEELAHLRERLELETASRLELAAEVQRLGAELERVLAARPAEEPRPRGGAPERPVDADEETAAPHSAIPERGFDTEALVAAGFRRSDVEAVRARLDGLEMERLYLRDRASREGWLDSSRFRQEWASLSEDLSGVRDEYGDELYDWMLYSTGQPNRVAVVSVIEGSPAAEAGVEPGDLIVRYDDRMVFSGRDLRQASSGGSPGVQTPVELIRAGRAVQVYLPRGPLGVRFQPRSAEPSAP